MWLYIPSNFAPGSACLEKAPEPDSSYWASSTEPFATWSGKHLQPRSLPALWKREPLIRRLSGLTCSPSTAQRGVDAWMASLPASHARTSASRAGALGLMASVPACFSTSWTSPTIATRGYSFWRTSAPSLLPPPPLWTKPKARLKSAPPPESWENWPTAGGTRNGSLFPRPMWAPATGAQGGSASHGAWPTPAASVPNDRETPATWHARAAKLKAKHGNGNGAGMPLTVAAVEFSEKPSFWMTPSVSNSQGNEYTRDRGMPGLERLTLTGQAQHWPTPASRDYRTPNSEASQTSRKHSGGEQLPNFVEHHFLHPVLSTLDGRALSPTARTLPRRLNPAFGCWLMGWPIWWTNPALTSCVRSEMELYRCRLQRHLSNLCGVLPLEGTEA
ncbi:cytosine-specific methyltransferase [Acidovorax phage Alfacinha3]|nr:cytosine-specific methyltransferase [Acidovorax phage Alfacinha3]